MDRSWLRNRERGKERASHPVVQSRGWRPVLRPFMVRIALCGPRPCMELEWLWGTPRELRNQSSWYRERERHAPRAGTHTLLHTHTCTHTEETSWESAWLGHTSPSRASPLPWGQLRSRGGRPAAGLSLRQSVKRPRNSASERGVETWTFGEPRNVLGSLLGLLHFVLFSGKQMEKKAPFPHFWRLICINRPNPITFRVNRETVRSQALGLGRRAEGDGALLVLPGPLCSLQCL